MPRHTRPKPMRKIAAPGPIDHSLVNQVWYRPHDQHCGRPLTYAPHKTKCPRGIDCAKALEMLKEGLKRSMFPPGSASELPSIVWAVDDSSGVAYEARVTNVGTSEYHGYPVLDTDPLKPEIIKKWRERAETN